MLWKLDLARGDEEDGCWVQIKKEKLVERENKLIRRQRKKKGCAYRKRGKKAMELLELTNYFPLY